MNMLFNIAICDDELSFLEYLYQHVEDCLSKYNYTYEIVDFLDSNEFIQYCRRNIADIVLVDIDMPKKDGFQAIKELQEKQPDLAVIFVSAHEELAYQSFKYNPFQFVSKADLDRLEEVLLYTVRKIEQRKTQKDIVHIMSGNSMIDINVKEVMYLQSDKNYVTAFDRHECALFKFRGMLKNIYTKLSEHGFLFIHKRYIVNCRFIKLLTRGKVVMSNDRELTISRNSETRSQVQALYGKFMREERW